MVDCTVPKVFPVSEVLVKDKLNDEVDQEENTVDNPSEEKEVTKPDTGGREKHTRNRDPAQRADVNPGPLRPPISV